MKFEKKKLRGQFIILVQWMKLKKKINFTKRSKTKNSDKK